LSGNVQRHPPDVLNWFCAGPYCASAATHASARATAEAAAADATALQSRLDALRVAHGEQSSALAAARQQVSDAAADSSTARTRLEERELSAGAVEGRMAQLEARLEARDAELRQAAVVRRALHNTIQELKAGAGA